MHILFSTYRTFTDTRTLINTLITRYQTVLPASLDMTEDIRQKTLKYEKKFFSKIYIQIFSYSYYSISETQTEYEYIYIYINLYDFIELIMLIFACNFYFKIDKKINKKIFMIRI